MDDTRASGWGVHIGSATNQIKDKTEKKKDKSKKMDDTRASGRGVHVGSATNQINWATEAPTLTIGEWTWSQEIKEEEWVEKTLAQWKIPI